MASKTDGGLAFTTTDDFVGYETCSYAVKARSGGGVRIKFISAGVTTQGKTTSRHRPLVPLFESADDVRFVRLVYMVRVSQTDHDMAIVAASDPKRLNNLTESVLAHPAEACRTTSVGICEWVPRGIGVHTDAKR